MVEEQQYKRPCPEGCVRVGEGVGGHAARDEENLQNPVPFQGFHLGPLIMSMAGALGWMKVVESVSKPTPSRNSHDVL